MVAVRLPLRADPLYVDPKRCLITTFCAAGVAVLTLLSSGGSEAMAALFARAELHRTDACGEVASRPAASPNRPDWLSVQTARQDAGLRGHVALR